MIGWLNDINRLVSKDKREHHESSQQKTSSRGSASSRPRPPPPTPGRSAPTSALPLRSLPTHRPVSCQLSPSRGVQPHRVDGSPMHNLQFDMRGVKGQTVAQGQQAVRCRCARPAASLQDNLPLHMATRNPSPLPEQFFANRLFY